MKLQTKKKRVFLEDIDNYAKKIIVMESNRTFFDIVFGREEASKLSDEAKVPKLSGLELGIYVLSYFKQG